PTIQGMSSVFLSGEEGGLAVVGTDLASYACIRLPAEVHSPGAVAVEWQYFSRVVSALTGGQVALSVSGSSRSLRLTCGPAAFRLRTTEKDDFPLLAPPDSWEYAMAAPDLADMIARTTFCAVDSDESSPFFGVWVSASPCG